MFCVFVCVSFCELTTACVTVAVARAASAERTARSATAALPPDTPRPHPPAQQRGASTVRTLPRREKEAAKEKEADDAGEDAAAAVNYDKV